MNASFYLPTRVFFGDGALQNGAPLFLAAGKHALIVTGRTSARACGALDELCALLDRLGITHTLFDRVTENPPLLLCCEAGKAAYEQGVDFVIGVGGGSPLDAAKAIAAFAANPTISPKALYDSEQRVHSTLPLFAIPTTAGTGSEVNPYSVLTLPGGRQKKTFKADDTWPRAAFVDPRYTATMSRELTVSTALDAFAHAMESYLSPRSTVFSERAALFAATEIFDVLSLYPEQFDSEMRERLSAAATAAGMAISVTGTGFPHPLGYSITLLDGIPHGRACAAFAADYLTYNEKTPEGKARIAAFSAAIGAKPAVLKTYLPALAAVDLSFNEEEIRERVELIVGAKNYVNSPYVLNKEEIYDIYRAHFFKK
ncbi:MAG: iron-containing alcohol dehydrogenase [Ruminococcaceae bacterium]|nr:iron-containing alcohol dehydrogenase [Oscillospiraceae bacterium]